ncbi:hypothetical protein CXF68_12385 [Tenacibaculum sp. Bg11-29]|uniref:hypothetical protein n=1 Tax=Tenacibaculum sp. Bg11-29 TaxID=2058306 RepID=UPI000C340F85|nr:hypothetical protein [Tenacibaculum sp. Bg11-29]PKH51430.1 hypothetical protein CXF68_12385 [Tenacibaculum sp. Bg11-29]
MKKKLIIGLIAGAGIYAAVKYQKVKESLNELSIKISGISNLKASFTQIRFNLSFVIHNPTNTHIGINTYKLLSLKQIKFYNKTNNAYLGTANVNFSNIQIPAKQTLEIKEVPTALPVKNILSNLALFKGNIEENLLIKLQFESLGKQFELIA